MRRLPAFGGSALILLATVSVHDASADVWLERGASGGLQLTNAPTSASPTLLLREIPRPILRRPSRVARLHATRVRPSRYDGLIQTMSERYGVDPALVKAVIRAESAFNPRAVSPKGAQGLMQLMPSTARRHRVYNSFSPHQNIKGGTEHLRLLLDRYAGNVTLALAAYNAGVNAVEKAGRPRVPPYRETREYIRRVLTYRLAYVRDARIRSASIKR
jgi:soluble lytic murein transglycosylase-like protein